MLGACVVRLWSHVVAPVFRKLLYLGGCMPRSRVWLDPGCGSWHYSSSFASALLEFLLLWLEFVSGQWWWWFVAPRIANSVSCESERLYCVS
ncbi:hypothetical protein Taro_036475 [Colocasia esculenta]|uniref:Uncharacterized protein n=1 Tax=Colocasia esculenta TaxID=4460 RepID=A0A843W364_COLES|nr:hypothetical protein [Colocasia esculenta]